MKIETTDITAEQIDVPHTICELTNFALPKEAHLLTNYPADRLQSATRRSLKLGTYCACMKKETTEANVRNAGCTDCQCDGRENG